MTQYPAPKGLDHAEQVELATILLREQVKHCHQADRHASVLRGFSTFGAQYL